MGKFNLKGLFIQTPEEEASSKPVVAESKPVTPTFTSTVSSATTVSAPTVDPTISASLTKALEDANLPSYDYLEFAHAVEQQASIIPDEATRFKSVGIIASQMGTTSEKLIEAAQKYLSVLKSKEEEFLKAMKDNSDAVNSLEKETSAIDTKIAEIMAEVSRLQEEKKNKLELVIQGRSKIDSVKSNFYATLNVFTSRITTDIEKIKTYLK